MTVAADCPELELEDGKVIIREMSLLDGTITEECKADGTGDDLERVMDGDDGLVEGHS